MTIPIRETALELVSAECPNGILQILDRVKPQGRRRAVNAAVLSRQSRHRGAMTVGIPRHSCKRRQVVARLSQNSQEGRTRKCGREITSDLVDILCEDERLRG